MWFLVLFQAVLLAVVVGVGCPLWAVVFIACNLLICLAMAATS